MIERSEFAQPGLEYRGVTLWMLDDKLEKDECARQIRSFAEAGWGALITRTFNGLRTEYLSEEWMEIMREAIDVGGETGLKVWLQAGYMPSAIPELKEEHTHRVLVRLGQDESPAEGDHLVRREGDYAYYWRKFEHVLDLLKPAAVQDYLRQAYEETWLGRFGDAFGGTVETIWVDEPHFRPPLLPWNEELPGVFARQWGYALTDHVAELYAPVGDYEMVRHHYWRTVTDMFMDAYFAEIGQWCAAHGVKFGGHAMGEDSLHAQISWTGAAMRCYEHMQLPGIDHLTLSLSWPNWHKFIFTPKQCSSAAHQLGRDQILAEMYGVSSQRISFEERKMLAHWLAALGITYRCYHGSFYSMRGVRKRIYAPHLSYQQPWWPENRRIADYFTRLSYALRQGQFQADALIIHPIESAFCRFDPTYKEPPAERVLGRRPKRMVGQPELEEMNDSLQTLSEHLLDIQRGFEYADEHLLALHGRVADGQLALGQMSYRVAILPATLTLRRSTVDLLNAFIDAGGTVLSVGELPARIDGRADPAIQALNQRALPVENSPEALRRALDLLVPASVEVSFAAAKPANIWVHERRLPGQRILFLANTTRVEGLDTAEQEETLQAQVRICGAGRLERWDLETSEVAAIPQRQVGDQIVAELTFPPVGAHLLVLQENEAPIQLEPAAPRVTRSVTLPGPYTVRRGDPNALTLDTCRYRRGQGEWSAELPVIAVQEILDDEGYRGPLSLRFRFQVSHKPANLQVVIEDAADWKIEVNGQAVAYAGLPYYVDRSFLPVEITPLAQVGANTIELTREFQPVAKAAFSLGSLFQTHTGVELESIYLIGDFSVNGTPSLRAWRPRCVRFAPNFVLAREDGRTHGDLVAAGYPFFAGRITLATTAHLAAPAAGERIVLALPNLDLPLAQVRVNGQEAGAILWPPYEIDITALARPGENEIAVELITSLRNLLGPHHRLDGERDDVWGNPHYSGRYESGKDWYSRRGEPGVEWTDDYFVLAYGPKRPLMIEYRA